MLSRDRAFELRSTSRPHVKPAFAGKTTHSKLIEPYAAHRQAREDHWTTKVAARTAAAEALNALKPKSEQSGEELEFVNEEDLSTDTDALWRRLQSLMATLWAAQISHTEHEALALILPRVQQVVKDYLLLSDPHPITSNLLKLVTAYPARVKGASYTTSNEIDPQMALSIVLKHLATGGPMTAQIAERIARFYLDLSRRSDTLVGASTDPDAQFSMRWSRDPVDAAFAVVLKALLESEVCLTRSTASQLAKLAERRGKLATAAEVQVLSPGSEANVSKEMQPGENAEVTLELTEAAKPDLQPVAAAAPEQPFDEAQQYRTMIRKAYETKIQMPFFQPFLPLVDAVLAMRHPEGNYASWPATLQALPEIVLETLKQQDLPEELYLEEAVRQGFVFVRKDEEGRLIVSLEEDGKVSPHIKKRLWKTDAERKQGERHIVPGAWRALVSILDRSSEDWATLRRIAQQLPGDRLRIYQAAGHTSNLIEYLERAEGRGVVVCSKDSDQGRVRILWNRASNHRRLRLPKKWLSRRNLGRNS